LRIGPWRKIYVRFSYISVKKRGISKEIKFLFKFTIEKFVYEGWFEELKRKWKRNWEYEGGLDFRKNEKDKAILPK